MTLISGIIFLPVVLNGVLLVHLLWPFGSLNSFALKVSLGIGLGLGLASILHFISLEFNPFSVNIFYLELILLVILFSIVLRQSKQTATLRINSGSITPLQWFFLILFFLGITVSVVVFARNIFSRPQGVLDAWSIWNRAARFIHRDPENWRATLSPDLALFRHADYPLMIPLNVAWGWDTLGNESLRVPMVQSLLFTFGTIFVMFGSLLMTRSIGQASLASLMLIAFSGIVVNGTYLISDVPTTYFVLASGVLLYLFVLRKEYGLLTLYGAMSGLAGWTKNEGLLFILVSPIGFFLAAQGTLKKSFLYYLAGIATPLILLLYFKTLTPPNDLMIGIGSTLSEKLLDPSRYEMIIKSFWGDFTRREAIFLAIYSVILFDRKNINFKNGHLAVLALLLFQLAGYGAIYVITPNDLEWHLRTSQYRLFMQIIPLAIFLALNLSTNLENIFAKRSALQTSTEGREDKHE